MSRSAAVSAAIAEVWKAPEDPRWEAAYRTALRALDEAIGSHNQRGLLEGGPIGIAELRQEFWCHLTASAAQVEARRAWGVAMFRFQAELFIESALSDSDRWNGIARLAAAPIENELFAALGSDDRFERAGPFGPWMLSSWQTSGPAGSDADCTTRAGASWLSHVTQTGAACRKDLVEEALIRAGHPRSTWDLMRECFPAMPVLEYGQRSVPNPASQDRENRRHSGDEGMIAWEARGDIKATEIVDSLTAGERAVLTPVLQVRFLQESSGSPPSETPEEVQRLVGLLQDRLCDIAEADELDAEEMEALLQAVVDILVVEDDHTFRQEQQ